MKFNNLDEATIRIAMALVGNYFNEFNKGYALLPDIDNKIIYSVHASNYEKNKSARFKEIKALADKNNLKKVVICRPGDFQELGIYSCLPDFDSDIAVSFVIGKTNILYLYVRSHLSSIFLDDQLKDEGYVFVNN